MLTMFGKKNRAIHLVVADFTYVRQYHNDCLFWITKYKPIGICHACESSPYEQE